MNKQSVHDRIVEIGIVPVIRASTPAEARLAARAVSQGGIPIVEITMTCPGALEVIAELVKSSGSELLVGAGTVLSAETARRCIDAVGQVLVNLGLDLQTVACAVK